MNNGRTNSDPSEPAWMCRGVRGATTATEDSVEAILRATRELLFTMIRANGIESEHVASVYFTTTPDLKSVYPAVAARQLGWVDVPLLCGNEIDVPTGLRQCVRILLHWNTAKSQKEISNVYLGEAVRLRPDKEFIPPIPAEEIEQYMQMVAEQLKKV